MPDSQIHHHTFPNGMALVAEELAGVRSAAFHLVIPAGSSSDPEQGSGSAGVLSELAFRGAGDMDSRQTMEYLDGLGLHRSTQVTSAHTIFSGALLATNLTRALHSYAAVAQHAHLPASEFEPSRDLIMQELISIEDDPISKVMQELKDIHYPYPLGRPTAGTRDGIQALTMASVAEDYRLRYRPGAAILGVAGDIRWEELRDTIDRLFGAWSDASVQSLPLRARTSRRRHITQETAQVQIGIAYDSVPYGHKDFYIARMIVGVLSGGMSGRLFVEVREKRGLAYAVSAACHTLKGHGAVLCYAGTTVERAQETLDLVLAELNRLREGIADEELERAKTGLLSSLVMEGESTTARSFAVASDWYMLGHVVPLSQVREEITRIRVQDLLAYLEQHPPGDFTFVTLGPRELALPGGAS